MSQQRTRPSTAPGTIPAAEDFRILFEAVREACVVLAADPPRFTIVAATDAYCLLVNRPRDSLVGSGLFDVGPPGQGTAGPRGQDAVTALREALAEVCRTGEPREVEAQADRGTGVDGQPETRHWRWCSTPVRGPDGAVRWIIHEVDDVTERIAAEDFQREMTSHLATFNERLSASAEERERLLARVQLEHDRAAKILESISDIFYAVDEQFRFTYVNKRAAESWGRSQQQLVGRLYWDEFPEAIGSESYYRHMEVMQERRPVHYETISPVLGRWIAVSIYPNEGGGLAVYFHEIEDRKRAEAERETARAEAEAANRALEQSQAALESRVAERTADLARANSALKSALAERRRAEAERNDLLRRLTLAQEEERRRLSRDLHDEIGQHLTALSLGLQALSEVVEPHSEADQRAGELRTLTSTLGRELHALAVRLRPKALDDFGLEAALVTYTEEWSRQHGIPVDMHARLDAQRATPVVENAVYRIVQEALTNVARHSRATRASVVVERHDGQLHAIVEDDGLGFDMTRTATTPERGLGLLNIRERASLLGGSVQVESAPGAGTTLFVRLPLRAGPEHPDQLEEERDE